MAERLLRAQPVSVANHIKARQSLIKHAVTWLATESGWAWSNLSAICSGKLCRGFIIFEHCCPYGSYQKKYKNSSHRQRSRSNVTKIESFPGFTVTNIHIKLRAVFRFLSRQTYTQTETDTWVTRHGHMENNNVLLSTAGIQAFIPVIPIIIIIIIFVY